MGKASGRPVAAPETRKGRARSARKSAKGGQADGSHRSRKGSRGTRCETRKARSKEAAVAMAVQARAARGARPRGCRSRASATPAAPNPSMARDTTSGTKCGQKRSERRRMRSTSSAMAAAETRQTAGRTPRTLPSVAKEADEHHGEDVALREAPLPVLLHQHQVLGHEGPAHRHHHAPPGLELVEQRRRQVTPGAGDDDGVEGRLLLPAEVAVALPDLDVGVAQAPEPLPGARGQGLEDR